MPDIGRVRPVRAGCSARERTLDIYETSDAPPIESKLKTSVGYPNKGRKSNVQSGIETDSDTNGIGNENGVIANNGRLNIAKCQ